MRKDHEADDTELDLSSALFPDFCCNWEAGDLCRLAVKPYAFMKVFHFSQNIAAMLNNILKDLTATVASLEDDYY